MKKILLLTILFCAGITAFAQKLPFQGKLIESGTPVDGTRTLEFSIADPAWSETHTDVPITDGLYFVVLGSITPLPDSLFYGVDEQSLDISVDGTALSPVILFKPLATPYEGGELNVKNSDGTIVGSLKAVQDSVKKNGELILNGTNGELNVSLGALGDGNRGYFQLHDEGGNEKANMWINNSTGIFTLYGDSASAIQGGFKAWNEASKNLPFFSFETDNGLRANIDVVKSDSIERGRLYVSSNINEAVSIQPHGWFAYKDNVHTGQFQSQNWGGLGSSGYLSINGTNTKNVDISSRHWENTDLPWMRFIGSENQDVIQMSAESNENESGNINILSKNGNSTYLSANGISSGNSSTQYYEFTTQDWGGQGHTGLLKINGSTTQNFELTSQSWINPNFPWFKLSGENLGDAVQMFLDNDGSEAANLKLFSLGRGSSSFTTDSWNMNGPSTNNISLGSRNWEGTPDLPFINLHGENNFHGIELSITRDGENNQFGWINLMSENGKSLHLSPNNLGVQGVGMSTTTNNSGTFGSFTLHGPNSDNFQLMPSWWENPDLPRMLLLGTSQKAAVDMGADLDGQQNEVGFISISSTDGSSANWRPNIFELNNTSGGQTIALETRNNGQGDFGELRLNGTNGNANVIVGANDLRSNEGFFGIYDSEGEKKINMTLNESTGNFSFLGRTAGNISAGYKTWNGETGANTPFFRLAGNMPGRTFMEMTTNNVSGLGEYGEIKLNGPTTTNFFFDARHWEDSDLPRLRLRGSNNQDVLQLSAEYDENESGSIAIWSKSQNTLYMNSNHVNFLSPDNNNTYIDRFRISFINNNGQEMTYNANGISGSGPLSISTGVNITGDVVVNGVTEHSSDRRFKKDIKSLAPNTLEKIQFIEGVSYNWRQDEFPTKNFSSDKQIGVIAQELEAQFPELVKTNKDGYKSVNYNGFTAVLLEAVKELNAKVEKLENENMQLKAELSASAKNSGEINQLKQQMEMLSKMVQQNSSVENSSGNEIVSTPGLK